MNEADRERLLDLCKREIYAKKLGVDYTHDDEDQKWWHNLKHQDRDEFEVVKRHAMVIYGYHEWAKAEKLRRSGETERGGEAQG